LLKKEYARAAFLALVPALISPTLAVLAQDKNSQKQNDEPAVKSAVIPPAPLIIKKNPNAISIPQVDGKPAARFEERNAVATTAKVGSSFGYRRDPFTRRERFHSGLDIKARLGDPVGASLGGVVQYAGWYHGYGNVVIVEHGGGVATHYAHLSAFAVEVGQEVARGTIVGYAGSTGRATSPHLHYEVRIAGNPVNPLEAVALDSESEYFTRRRPSADGVESTLVAAQPVHTILSLPVSAKHFTPTLGSTSLALAPVQPVQVAPLPAIVNLPPAPLKALANLTSTPAMTELATASSLLVPLSSSEAIASPPVPVTQNPPEVAKQAVSNEPAEATRARRVVAGPLAAPSTAAETGDELNSTRPRRVGAAAGKNNSAGGK
jgi:hypothetical protein